MKKERVVISTVYSGNAIKVVLKNLKPDKLILLVDDPIHETKKETIQELNEKLQDIISIETIKTSLYDIPEIMKKVTKSIDQEFDKENEIILHITEGRKITSLALLFSGYSRKDKVHKTYYVTQEDDKLLQLPTLVRFDVNENQKRFLQEIGKGVTNSETLMENLKIKQSAFYKYTKELKREGFLKDKKELELTEMGEIVSI